LRLFSITNKQVVAITGLLMSGFLVAHLSGNLLILQGAEQFNEYAKFLAELRPGLLVAEFGLLAIFLIHIAAIIRLVRRNRRARDRGYGMYRYKGGSGLAVRSMVLSGLVTFFFVGIHLWQYTFTAHEGSHTVVAGEELGLYGLVYNSYYHSWINVIWYVLAMVVIGFHLDHGIQSSIKTLGFNHMRYTPVIRVLGRLFAIVIAVGFAIIPLYVILFNPMDAS